MKWQKIDKYNWRSADAKWNICLTRVYGREIYSLYWLPDRLEGNFDSLQEAAQEADAIVGGQI